MEKAWLYLVVLLVLSYQFMGCSSTKKLINNDDDEPKITVVGPELIIELPMDSAQASQKFSYPSFVEMKKMMDSAMFHYRMQKR